MTDSLRTFFERLLLCCVCFLIPAIFFVLFVNYYKANMVERKTQDFIKSVSAKGYLERTEYENFLLKLAEIGGYEAKVSYTSYCKEPRYGYYASDDVERYYSERNLRIKHPVTSEADMVEVASLDSLFLKTNSNASVLASELSGGVSLPLDGSVAGVSFSVVVPEQEMYVGEPLTTVLQAQRDGMTYYCVGDSVFAAMAGTYEVLLKVNGFDTGQKVRVTAWDKTVTCEKGHVYPRTKDVITNYKATGKWEQCPYCERYVSAVAMVPTTCTVALGTLADALPVTLKVTYLDGHLETIPFSAAANDYSAEYAGEQEISVSYGGKNFTVGTIKTSSPGCSVCGSSVGERSNQDCLTEPRCVTCICSSLSYLGEYENYKADSGDSVIRDILQSEDVFKMNRGDYLSVEVIKGRENGLLLDLNTYYRMGSVIRGTMQGE